MSRHLFMHACAFHLVLATSAAHASPTGQEIAGQVSGLSYRHYLDDELYTHDGHNRMWGPEHDLARDNIAAVLESFGLQVELHSFTYNSQTYHNVVATQVGSVYPEQEYIVGAHYDSYCYECDSAPGADDNASGVAGVMEIARVLSQYNTQNTVKYIAFDREEQWMIGSYAYVDDHVNDDIRSMINLDMIAWDGGDYRVVIESQPQNLLLADGLADAVNEYAPDLFAEVFDAGPSDHMPFEEAGFVACGVVEDDVWTIWNGLGNLCYHEPCDSVDTPGYLNYEYAVDIVRSVGGYLADVALLDLTSRDCDQNGQLDSVQIAIDPLLDCNEDGTIDTCEPQYDDCNGNEVADFCDVFDGTSEDCSGNLIPDECEPDCNGNGAADSCDIDDTTSSDCNANLVPDECDIASGESLDDDGNGVPDECERVPVTLGQEGCRRLSVTLGVDPALPVALLVTSPDYPCLSEYVQEDGRLGDSPRYRRADEWDSPTYVRGPDIVPDTTYQIQAEPTVGELSEPGTATTALWGDTAGDFVEGAWTPPDGNVDFNDITATVDAFRQLPDAPPWRRCDVVPRTPDGVIDFDDIAGVVDGFRGLPYPHEGPAPCP